MSDGGSIRGLLRIWPGIGRVSPTFFCAALNVEGTWPGHPPEAGRARKSCAAEGRAGLEKSGSSTPPMPGQQPAAIRMTRYLSWIGIGLAAVLASGCAAMPLRPASSSGEDAQGGTQVGGLLDLERAARSATLVQAVSSAQWSSGLLPPEAGDMLEVKTPDVDRKAVGFIGERVQLGPDGKPVSLHKPLTMRLPWGQIDRVRSGFDLRDQYVDLIKPDGDAIRIYFPDQFARDRFQTALEAVLPDLRAKNLTHAP